LGSGFLGGGGYNFNLTDFPRRPAGLGAPCFALHFALCFALKWGNSKEIQREFKGYWQPPCRQPPDWQPPYWQQPCWQPPYCQPRTGRIRVPVGRRCGALPRAWPNADRSSDAAKGEPATGCGPPPHPSPCWPRHHPGKVTARKIGPPPTTLARRQPRPTAG